MNSRIEIRIVVLGEPDAGKETFCQMLFLENGKKIRVDPLSKLAELYLETDPLNFPSATKKLQDECKAQNNLIMQQSEIKSLQNLRDNNIEPFFYRYTRRVPDLINYEVKDNRINGNIMLNFYFIGNNYMDFEQEINSANILIYLIDINKSLDTDRQMFNYLSNIIKMSNNTKYLLTVINKCDILNANGEFDISTPGSRSVGQIDQIIREFANDGNMHQNMLPPITISCKYACLYRQIIKYYINDLSIADKLFVSNTFAVKKENIIKDIRKDNQKYLTRCGFIAFRDVFADILNTKFKSMVDFNFDNDIQRIDRMIQACKELSAPVKLDREFVKTNSQVQVPLLDNQIVNHLKILQDKTKRLTKIFKKDYSTNVLVLIKKIINFIDTSTNPNLYIIDNLKEMYQDDITFYPEICTVRDRIYGRVIECTTLKLYGSELNMEIFLPSNVFKMFTEIYDGIFTQKYLTDNNNVKSCQNHITKLANHICELYSIRARSLLYTNINLLFDTYFLELESNKISHMLNEIQTLVKFDVYKNYLIQMLLTKLMVASEYMYESKNLNNKNIIITYCKSLKYYLSNLKCKKYEYLFSNICDICTSLTLKMDISKQLLYISENIDTVINFKTDKIIELDRFIVKRLLKNNYQSMIAAESENESDDDIYDHNSFTFNNDDINSDNGDEVVTDCPVKKKSRKNFREVPIEI